MRKITKGIIFAAGMGTRLRPLSLETPKPLLKVKGRPMIETIITAMIANGVNKIYVVVGYKKEKFFYLKDKYEEVEFVLNEDYQTRNTISSFYACRELLNDDFIISEGDLLVEDVKIFNTKISKSTYLYRPDQLQNNEWGFKLDHLTNNVLEIRKPDEKIYLNNNLYGVSFWLKEDLKVIKEEIVNNYFKEEYTNSAYDELINNVINNLEIGVREVNNKQITEIDSLDELFLIDNSYMVFKSIDLLCQVLNIKREDITSIYDNPGRSLNNYNFIVEVGVNKYLVRIPGKGTELFCDREAEKKAYLELDGFNLVEENYYLDPISGIKISKYYDNSRIIDMNNQLELKKLMANLNKLHNGNFNFHYDNVFDRMRRYDSFVASVGGRKHYQKEIYEAFNEVLELEKSLSSSFLVKPIHGDLSPNNILVTKDKEILFVDIEFISSGEPFTDLATVSHDGNLSPEETTALLELYLNRKSTKNERIKMFAICAAVSVMWYYWSVFKMTVEEESFYKYKEYRDLYLDYAKVMLKAVKE